MRARERAQATMWLQMNEWDRLNGFIWTSGKKYLKFIVMKRYGATVDPLPN